MLRKKDQEVAASFVSQSLILPLLLPSGAWRLLPSATRTDLFALEM